MGGFATVIALFFTGSYVPIPFFPTWLRAIVEWLPFNALMNVPAQLFLGKLTGDAMLLEFLRQIGWIVVLTLLVRVVTKQAVKRVVVQGG